MSSSRQSFRLIHKETLTSGAFPVRLFRFALRAGTSLNLPLGHHLMLSLPRSPIRPYTPISTNDQKGYFDLVIKIYPEGALTPRLDQLALGDRVSMYSNAGKFSYERGRYQRIVMLAGGTGMTPMWQIIQEVLRNEECGERPHMLLLFGNMTFEDIIMKRELDELAADHPESLQVVHVLASPPEDSARREEIRFQGFITADVIRECVQDPLEAPEYLICGPDAMQKAMVGNLQLLGVPEAQIHVM